MRAKLHLGLLLAGSTLFLSGCSIGPKVIRCNFLRYNDAIADTDSEQFLLNLVRLRYRDPPKTIAVNNINSQYTFDEVAPFALNLPSYIGRPVVPRGTTNVVNPLTFATTTLGPFSSRLTDVPTISMTPQTGADFFRGLVTPIPVDRIILLASTGWDLDRLLRLLVHNLNGVENATHLAGAGSERAPRYSEFAYVAEVMGHLHHRDLLELTLNPTPMPLAPLSEPFSGEVKAAEVEKAALDRFQYQKVTEQKTAHDDKPPEDRGLWGAVSRVLFGAEQHPREKYVLKSTMTVYDMNVAPAAWQDPCWQKAAEMLQLIPGGFKYRVRQGDGHLERVLQGPGTDVVVGTRSLFGALVYLSKGIEVPPEHIEAGLVRQPTDENGQPFDWTQLTQGLFRVHVQKKKPKHAFVAVQYRDYWFYIADDDPNSKSSFGLLLEMFDVQIAPGVATAPIVTISASGPVAR